MAVEQNPITFMMRAYRYGKPTGFFCIIGKYCIELALITIAKGIAIGLFCAAGIF
jgi:hypothetical protein